MFEIVSFISMFNIVIQFSKPHGMVERFSKMFEMLNGSIQAINLNVRIKVNL